MWIAFKNYYLRDEGQLVAENSHSTNSCELLSKIIIFVMKDNLPFFGVVANLVVNCFQKLLSSWWRTTASGYFFCIPLLWIAFKNYYLRDEGQHMSTKNWSCASCELLSKIIIFVMKDNSLGNFALRFQVVNCFQKLLSSWWRTTIKSWLRIASTLWIAFKNYYLRDEGQLWK